MLLPPVNPLVRNVGNGALEVAWDEVTGATSYDVYLSTSLSSGYAKANKLPITSTRTKLPNLPFGTTVFVKVKAVNAEGASAFSDAARDATARRAVSRLAFTGPSGDTIAAGALFTAVIDGEMIAVVTKASGVIP